MYILAQDGTALINGEYVSRFSIDKAPTGEFYLDAVFSDESVTLGTYPKLDHATTALKFIGHCLVDEDAQGKVTAIPSQEDMALKDELTAGSMPSAATLEKLMEKLTGGGGRPRLRTILTLALL